MEIREIFKKKFGLPRDGYSEPIDLQDAGVGFSVYKEQDDLRRKDFKSMFKVYIKKEELEKTGDIKPIVITVSYGKTTEDGIILVSGDLNGDHFGRGLNWPAELIIKDEFFYNTRTHDFSYKKQVISGKKILDKVNNWHLKPTRLDGFWHIIKSFCFHVILAGFFKMLFYIVSGFQYLVSGRKVNFYLRIEDQISPQDTPGKIIEIFNYKVETWIAVVYAIIHLLIVYPVSFYYDYKPKFLVDIFKNSFLTVMYAIISLGLTDAILSKLPRVYFTKSLLSFIQEKYYEMLSKNIKI